MPIRAKKTIMSIMDVPLILLLLRQYSCMIIVIISPPPEVSISLVCPWFIILRYFKYSISFPPREGQSDWTAMKNAARKIPRY